MTGHATPPLHASAGWVTTSTGMTAYQAEPAQSAPTAAVIVLAELFGLTPHVTVRV